MFALFEDDFIIIHGTAGFAAFGSSTSGYGYSPPSATLSRDDNQLKMCLLCTCENSVNNSKLRHSRNNSKIKIQNSKINILFPPTPGS